MRERFAYIDFLRAFSILGVIAIHTLSFSLNNSVNLFIWNSLQFVVAVFIFCSGFVHAHYESKLNSLATIFSWYKKRGIRILLPFYIYFCVHFSLFLVFPNFFTHFGLQRNIPYILGSLFLYNGINASWLPLLFLELTVLTPFVFFLTSKKLLWVYIVGSALVIAIGTVWLFPYSWYRASMWIGWSLIFLLGLFSPKFANKTTKLFASLVVSGLMLFGFLFFIWPSLHRSFNFTDNKYPPNFYYLSYAIAGTSIVFLLSKRCTQYFPKWTYEYISKKSYQLFFIHYIILDFLLSTIGAHSISLLFVLTIAGSICMSLVLDKVVEFSRNYWINWDRK